ncbi:sugar ABC transporter ATP-binding protein [Spongiactinospora sp. 9N601]|uniref:sugar ABC transporter ATP-binding protein n=1 Tax=Spongiactinospora sp. 9N601 TaxID=3375149 RepID=UPI00378EA92F
MNPPFRAPTTLAPEEAARPGVEVVRLSKTFKATRALRDVSLQFAPGQVHALLGGNGSGKSTLIKTLAGIQPGDPGGRIVVAGESTAADHVTPAWSHRQGLRFVHQDPGVFPTLSVAENLALGHRYETRGGLVNWAALSRNAARLIERFHIEAEPGQLLGDLRPADRTMVAIARALQERATGRDTQSVSVLVLDEPTASLPEEEAQILLRAARRSAAEGLAVIFVSHRLDEVQAVADTITVLRDGQVVASRPRAELTQSDIVELIVGSKLERVGKAERPARTGVVRARLTDVAVGPLRGVTMEVRAGEILGLAGLLGSGRTEVLKVLFGDLKPTRGKVELPGGEHATGSISTAMRSGIAYIPEDRADAVFAGLSVRSNFSAPSLSRYRRFGWVRKKAESRDAIAAMSRLRVKAGSWEAPISTLSGGNQQKVVLARWLSRSPRLLLLDEPTQGVDVGARADAYEIIRESATAGMAVVVVSSDFEELADLCDRVLVLAGGRVATELSGDQIDQHNLTEQVLMRGTTTDDPED